MNEPLPMKSPSSRTTLSLVNVFVRTVYNERVFRKKCVDPVLRSLHLKLLGGGPPPLPSHSGGSAPPRDPPCSTGDQAISPRSRVPGTRKRLPSVGAPSRPGLRVGGIKTDISIFYFCYGFFEKADYIYHWSAGSSAFVRDVPQADHTRAWSSDGGFSGGRSPP